MVGCRFNAKNTLDKNYLWLAEKEYGACIVPETEVTRIEPLPGDGYSVTVRSSTGWFRKRAAAFTCNGIVVSGGVLGTLDLLLRQKHIHKTLPDLSDRLGENLLTKCFQV
jgi:cholesterol oxidase